MTQIIETVVPATTMTLADEVLGILRESATPLTVPQIEAKLTTKPKKNAVRHLMGELISQNRVFECGKSGRQFRYWDRDETVLLRDRFRQKVLELLRQGPCSEKDLINSIKVVVPGWNGKTIKHALLELQQEKLIYPQLGKGKRFGLEAPNPVAELTFSKTIVNNLRKSFDGVKKYGATLEQFLQRLRQQVFETQQQTTETLPEATPRTEAPREVDPQSVVDEPIQSAKTSTVDPNVELKELILKVLHESGVGVPTNIREVKELLPAEYRTKDRFDIAVWQLVEQELVYVSRHNYPAALTDEERAELLKDNRGDYYAYLTLPSR